MTPWPIRPLPFTQIPVGPCAWSFELTQTDAGAQHLQNHPSLIVVGPDDLDPPNARPIPAGLAHLPLALHLREPEFLRRLAGDVAARLDALGRPHADALILHVETLADIKSGGAMQVLGQLRDAKRIRHIGLAAPTALDAEWLAGVASAKLIALPFGVDEQLVRYRALAALREMSMDVIADTPLDIDASPGSIHAARFALATADQVLPVFRSPWPDGLAPLSEAEAQAQWEAYSARTPAPAALPRSRPPE